MSLFHKARAEKPPADWSRAYIAAPRFYGKPDGTPFGAIALTEATETVLPKTPQKEYAINGKPVADWKVVLISTTKNCVIGDCDYFRALAKLKNYVQDANDNAVLIRALSSEELEAIAEWKTRDLQCSASPRAAPRATHPRASRARLEPHLQWPTRCSRSRCKGRARGAALPGPANAQWPAP